MGDPIVVAVTATRALGEPSTTVSIELESTTEEPTRAFKQRVLTQLGWLDDVAHARFFTHDKEAVPDNDLIGSFQRKRYFQSAADAESVNRITLELVVDHQPIDADGPSANVAVERDKSARKKFMGGYRDKTTGVEYHHADAQTVSAAQAAPSRPSSTRVTRETQTVAVSTRSAQSKRDSATQMARRDLLPTNPSNERVIEAGPYTPADDFLAEKERQTVNIQCFVRLCFAWRRIERLRYQKQQEQLERKKAEEELTKAKEEIRTREITRRMQPRTKEDFDILVSELEAWRLAETNRIKGSTELTEEARKKALERLLRDEISMLRTIDSLRLDAERKDKEQGIRDKLAGMVAPSEWSVSTAGANGEQEVLVQTPWQQRQRELVEMYYGLGLSGLPRQERTDLLHNAKWAVKQTAKAQTATTKELDSLLSREIDLIGRGRSEASLEGLRKRISSSFLAFVRECDNRNALSKDSAPSSAQSGAQRMVVHK